MSSVPSQVLVDFRMSESSPDFAEINRILPKSAGFCWIWQDLKEILADLNKIRPDLEKILVELNKIKLDLKEIKPDLDEISPDLNKSNKTKPTNHSNQWRTAISSVFSDRVGWKSVFHAHTRQPIHWSWVLGAETRCQPSLMSSRMVLGSDQPSWLGFGSGWTPLLGARDLVDQMD